MAGDKTPRDKGNDTSGNGCQATTLHSDETVGNAGGKLQDQSQDVEDAHRQAQVNRLSTADRPYTTFTSHQKFFLVLVSTLGGCFSPFTANIYLPAIDIISQALKVSVTSVNLTITAYMIFQGIAPSFVSAIADDLGRRPAYVIGFAFYMAANLGLGLNNSYAGLVILRCVQACGSSGLVTLNQGTIADIITSAERGKYISVTAIASVVAPSIAPIIGGALAQHLGWHSIFWFLLIASGVYFVPLMLFFPETGRNIVGDGSIPPPRWNRCLTDIMRDKKRQDPEKGNKQDVLPPMPKKKHKIDVLGSVSVVSDLETAMILTVIGVIYAAFYAINTSLTVQFGRIYNLSPTVQGLLFLPQAVGSIAAAVFNSNMVDRQYRKHAQRIGLPVDKRKQINILTSAMPIERARIELVVPMVTIGSVAIIGYGWLLQTQVSIAGPIIMLVLLGFLMLSGFSTLSVLVIDLHRNRTATASAANNLVRCLLGAAASAVVIPMIEAMGNGWCFTFWGLITMATVPLLILCMSHGPKLRQKRSEKEEAKAERKPTP